VAMSHGQAEHLRLSDAVDLSVHTMLVTTEVLKAIAEGYFPFPKYNRQIL